MDPTGQPPAAGNDAAAAPAPGGDGAPADGSDPGTAPAAGTDPGAGAGEGGDQPAGGAPADGGDGPPAGGDVTAAAAAAAKKPPNLTARLAALSVENRKAKTEAAKAQRELETVKARLAPVDALIARAQSGDMSVMPELYKLTGIDFRKVVEYHATQGEDAAPPDDLTVVKNELAELRKQREEEAKAAATRAQEASRAEMLGSIRGAIKAHAEKFEICERLGDEAAADVFAEVAEAWTKAGRPTLEPGEFDEAVVAAIEVQEMRYVERGKKLVKKAKDAAADAAIAAAAGKAAPGAATNSDLPAGIAGGELSDKDEDILQGLIDKTAPSVGSARARPTPRTIGHELGGSAPPRVAPTGDKDPRDALRDVLAPFTQSAAIS